MKSLPRSMPLPAAQTQRGITLMGFLIVLMVVGFFLFLGMRLFQPYADFNTLKRSMDAVAKEPGAVNFTLQQARASLEKRLYVDYVKDVPMACLSLDKKTGAKLTCTYDSRSDFMYNIDFLISYTYTVNMGG